MLNGPYFGSCCRALPLLGLLDQGGEVMLRNMPKKVGKCSDITYVTWQLSMSHLPGKGTLAGDNITTSSIGLLSSLLTPLLLLLALKMAIFSRSVVTLVCSLLTSASFLVDGTDFLAGFGILLLDFPLPFAKFLTLR